MNKICQGCHINKGTDSRIFNIKICKECRKTDKFHPISMTRSKNEYLLTSDDLSNLQHYDGMSGYGPTTYYSLYDVKQFLSQRDNIEYDNIDSYAKSVLEEKRKKKDEKRAKAAKEKARKNEITQGKRKVKLIEALAKYKLKLRSDSVLCEKYIDGSKEFTIDEVVQRMCQMKYLYEYCHMDACKQEAYESQREEFNAGYFPDMSVSEQGEMIALRKYSNGKYPEIFPWMQ
jgi:hypothetical protein